MCSSFSQTASCKTACHTNSLRSFCSCFADKDEATARAKYMVGNFLASKEIEILKSQGDRIVLDRYYCSTLSYKLSKQDEPLPPPEDPIYQWPSELTKPDVMFVLVLPEHERLKRLIYRSSVVETLEERLLRNDSL